MERSNSKNKAALESVESLKAEWKRLWKERLDDKVRAEGIANEDYSSLSVEKGTVIFATRDFKLLSFRGILEEHGITETWRFVSPSPAVGGWGKFIRDSIRRNAPSRAGSRAVQCLMDERKPQQLRKGGRGWLRL